MYNSTVLKRLHFSLFKGLSLSSPVLGIGTILILCYVTWYLYNRKQAIPDTDISTQFVEYTFLLKQLLSVSIRLANKSAWFFSDS